MASIEVEGFKDLDKMLSKITLEMVDDVEKVLLDVAEEVALEAKKNAPVGKRNSASTIHAEKDRKYRKSKTFRKVSVMPDAKNWQLIFPEYGTIHQKAQPFLRPALENKRDDVNRKVRVAIEELIKKYDR